MNKTVKSPAKKSPLVLIIIIAAVIAVIGGIVLMSNKVQQSDPTLTAAPPAKPGAVKLYPPPGKAAMIEQEGAIMRAKMGNVPGQASGQVAQTSENAKREERIAANSKLPAKVREHLSAAPSESNSVNTGPGAPLPGGLNQPAAVN